MPGGASAPQFCPVDSITLEPLVTHLRQTSIDATLSRRGFLAATASAAIACSQPTWAAPGSAAKPKYIDIHTHLGAFYPGKDWTAEMLVRFMDEHDVEKSCVLPLISPESAPITQPVTTALAAFKQFPERIIPFAALDPRAVTEPGKRAGHVVPCECDLRYSCASIADSFITSPRFPVSVKPPFPLLRLVST